MSNQLHRRHRDHRYHLAASTYWPALIAPGNPAFHITQEREAL
jgi:hypothetical protein